MDDLFDILTKFVAIAGTIDYGYKAIKLLVRMYEITCLVRILPQQKHESKTYYPNTFSSSIYFKCSFRFWCRQLVELHHWSNFRTVDSRRWRGVVASCHAAVNAKVLVVL